MADQDPPYSAEAEQSVIGSVLIDPAQFGDLSAIITPEDFYIHKNRFIWEAVGALHKRGACVDFVTVADELHKSGKLEAIGGPAHITSLISNTPHSFNASDYVNIVVESSVRRRMLASATKLAQLAYAESRPIDLCIADAEQSVKEVITGSNALRGTGMKPTQIGDEFKELVANKNGTALDVGIPELNRALGGWFPQEVTTIAARPGVGKTAGVLQLARTQAFKRHRVLFFALEMSRIQLWSRMVVPASGLDWRDVRTGNIKESDHILLSEISDRLTESLGDWLIIDDTPGATIFDIRRSVAFWQPEIVFIDQLPDVTWHERGVSQVIWYGEAMKFFHAEIARRYNIPVVVVTQLSRRLEERNIKKPILSDLRWSGDIEQRSDIVIFLYRDDMYNDVGIPNTYVVPVEWIIAKHRQGDTRDEVVMDYDLRAQWFGEYK